MNFLLYWRDKRIGHTYSWGEVFSDPWIWMWLVILVYGIFAARRKMKESKEEPFDGQKEQSPTPAAEKQETEEQEEKAASAAYLRRRLTLALPVLGFCVSDCLMLMDWDSFGLLLILLILVGAMLVLPALPANWAKTSFAEDRKNGRKLDWKTVAKRSKGQLILFGAGVAAGILFGLLSL